MKREAKERQGERNDLKNNIGSNLSQSSKKPDKAKSVAVNLPQAIAKKAKENQGARNDICQKSDKSIDTKKEVAKIAGVSHDTIHRVEVRIGELLKQKKLSVPKSFSILHRIVHIPETDANEKIPTKITVHPDTVRRFSLRKLDS